MTERAKKALLEFRNTVTRISEVADDPENAAAVVVAAMLEESRLLSQYENSDDPQDQARRENLDQLLAAAREHEKGTSAGGEGDDPSLAGFLDAVTLRADADDVEEKRGVVLMTLHSAKGLEFDEVFLAGVEDGSLPHFSSREDDDQLEEERRLAYVGMTRAKERLTISYALRRMVRGEWMNREPSPFLDAIPARVLTKEDLSSRRFERADRAGREASPSHGRFAESLFPDYENESQERPAAPAPRFVAPVRRPVVPVAPTMKRTPPPPTASGFRRGARVRHPDYGQGVVLSIEGSGDAEKLTVYFDRAGRKKFVAKFANLSPG
jgi:DNA helicase-2/ATP-dependent DNA helicase PcrA